jgi:hypothetical protein
MKVNGVLDIVLTDFNYYLKIRKNSKTFPEQYKICMERFYSDEVSQLDNEIELLKKKKKYLEDENLKEINSEVTSETENEKLEDENDLDSILDGLFGMSSDKGTEEVEEEVSSGGNAFLSAMQGIARRQEQEPIVEEVGVKEVEEVQDTHDDSKEYVSHGIYIDEWVKKDYVSHGIYIDEWVNPNVNESYEDEIVEDTEYKENAEDYEEVIEEYEDNEEEEEVEEESTEDFEEVIEEYEDEEEDYIDEGVENEVEETSTGENSALKDFDIDSILDDLLNEKSDNEDKNIEDVVKTEEVNFEQPSVQDKDNVVQGDLNVINIQDYVPKEDTNILDKPKEPEKIEVPANIRDFIKGHQGSTIDFVLQYYKKKDVDKALSLGKVYKKNGKLYT